MLDLISFTAVNITINFYHGDVHPSPIPFCFVNSKQIMYIYIYIWNYVYMQLNFFYILRGMQILSY